MKIDESDRPLRRLFQEMRREELRHAPSFARLTESANAPQAVAFPWMRLAYTLAAVAVIAVGISLIWHGQQTKTREVRTTRQVTAADWQNFSRWEASTDVLLESPSSTWADGFSFDSDVLLSSGSSVSPGVQIEKEQKGESNET